MLSCSSKKSNIIFEEHFSSSKLNTTNWNYDIGNGCPQICGWGNNELQFYKQQNVRVSNGNLVITAQNDSIYTSGKIHTKDKITFTYGTIEVRAKLPKGKGLWPAIWLLGNNINQVGWPACGEIDMMEYVGKEPGVLFTSMHTPSSHGNTINTKKTAIKNLEEDFHVYKCVWTENEIAFYINDQHLYTYNPAVKNDKTWPYNKPFYLILNLAIGGNFGGPEVDNTIFPAEFVIDYIKVYKN